MAAGAEPATAKFLLLEVRVRLPTVLYARVV